MLVAGDDYHGAGADRPVVLHRDRIADGNLAGAQPACGKIVRPLLDAMQTTPTRLSIWCRLSCYSASVCRGVVVTDDLLRSTADYA